MPREDETEAPFARAVEAKEQWLVEGAAHIDMMNYGQDEYPARVAGFLERHFLAG